MARYAHALAAGLAMRYWTSTLLYQAAVFNTYWLPLIEHIQLNKMQEEASLLTLIRQQFVGIQAMQT